MAKSRSSVPITPQQNNALRNQLRIIGGKWRGRKLSFPDANGLRPTGDRIRETLFNWLQADIPESYCLDLFAGSGALGLEALSRGAGKVQFLEKDRSAIQHIQAHLQLLGVAKESAEVFWGDTLQWLTQTPATPADVIFLDPPFQLNLWDQVITTLESAGWVKPDTLIYIETPRDQLLQMPQHWRLHREKNAGSVSYRLFFAC